MTQVNINNQTVEVLNGSNWECCSFEEAGLCPNGQPITDPDDIENHLRENRGLTEIEFIG